MSSTPIGPEAVSLPAHVQMPADGLSFDNASYIALPAAPSGNKTVVSFTVPEGFHGVIKRLGNEIAGGGWIAGSGSLIWQIQANGGVIRNYDSIVASLGAVNNPAEVAGILVFEQQLIQLVLNNVNLIAGGAQVGGRLSGWFFPKWRMPDDIW